MIAELKKQRIKNKTEWIGFFDAITNIEEITSIDEKNKNKKVVKFLSKKIFNDIESQILIFFLFLPPTCLRFLVIFLYYKLILI